MNSGASAEFIFIKLDLEALLKLVFIREILVRNLSKHNRKVERIEVLTSLNQMTLKVNAGLL